MTWFGWLFKPRLQVTLFDHFTMWFEVGLTLIIGYVVVLFAEKVYFKWKRRK